MRFLHAQSFLCTFKLDVLKFSKLFPSQYVISWFQCIADPGIRYIWLFLYKKPMPVITRCQAHSDGLGRDEDDRKLRP